jgi:hypothetical protein
VRDVKRVQRKHVANNRPGRREYELDLEEEVDLADLEEDVHALSAFDAALGSGAPERAAIEAPPETNAQPRPALSAFSAVALGTPKSPDGPQSSMTFKKPATFAKPSGAPPAPSPPVESAPKIAPPKPETPSAPSASAPVRVPPPGAPRVPPPAGAKSSDDPSLRRLYDAYVAARRRNNEPIDNVAYDKIAESVRKMKTQLREKHGEKSIDFEIVVQNGKVGFKPKIG